MKTLVVYYSRTGNTRKLAEMISSALGAESEEIRDQSNRTGILGYLRSGKEAVLGHTTPIDASDRDFTGFDVVIVGTPVWASSVSSPVRTFLGKQPAKLSRVAFFCTMGGSGSGSTFRQMEQICGRAPVATMAASQREMSGTTLTQKVQEFVSRIKGH